MVVDESGSIGQADFDKIKRFLSDIVNKFSVSPFGVHFGLVKYSTKPRMVFSLTKFTDASTMQKHIVEMKYRGGQTRTGSALEFTETNVSRREIRKPGNRIRNLRNGNWRLDNGIQNR